MLAIRCLLLSSWTTHPQIKSLFPNDNASFVAGTVSHQPQHLQASSSCTNVRPRMATPNHRHHCNVRDADEMKRKLIQQKSPIPSKISIRTLRHWERRIRVVTENTRNKLTNFQGQVKVNEAAHTCRSGSDFLLDPPCMLRDQILEIVYRVIRL